MGTNTEGVLCGWQPMGENQGSIGDRQCRVQDRYKPAIMVMDYDDSRPLFLNFCGCFGAFCGYYAFKFCPSFHFFGGKRKQSFVHFRIEPVMHALGGAGSFRHQQIWERYLL